MSNHPQDQADSTLAGDDSDDPLVDTADVIRRLDKLWQSQPDVADRPVGSLVGTKVGRYNLERIIGRGAFGIVYKAHDPDLNRAVAIKIPRPDVLLDSDRLARFESEALACARLDHPGIVPLYEADLSRAVPYMASAYCPGPNLQQWIDEFGVPCEIESAVALIEKVARAVQFAHDHGVVHRDLKPANILLVPNESNPSALNTLDDFQPRLTDFGLAQITHGMHESQSSLILGTPLYMSPEQAESRSDDIGPGSDLFGLGAILYHLLTGIAPFAAPNYAAVLLRLREENPAPVSALRPDVDVDLETICMKCLRREPADRYASAEMLADDLNRWLNRLPIHARRMSLMQRFRRWSQQIARVYEASLLIIALSCIRLTFGPIAVIMALASQDVTVTRNELVEIVLANALFIVPHDLWTAWAARRNMMHRSSSWLYWAAFLLSSAGCVAMILISMGILPAVEWYRRSIGARILVFGLLSMIFFAQTLAWYFADWNRIKSNPMPATRRYFKWFLVYVPLVVAFAVPCVRYASRYSGQPILEGPTESIRLNGTSDFLMVENVGVETQTPLTLEAWIRPDKSHRGAIASHGPFAITVVAAGVGNRFRIHLAVSGDRVYLLDAKEPFALNRWTHVAMTCNRGEIRMYLNGHLQEYNVSVYDTKTNLVTPNVTVPDAFPFADLWPGSRFLIGNIIQMDSESHFHFSGRIGEIRLNRALFYHEEFEPERSLKAVPETVLLFHFREGQTPYPDATGRYFAVPNRIPVVDEATRPSL